MNGRDMDRFWSRVTVGGPDDCWPWNAAVSNLGYGRFGNGTHGTTYAHRIAYLAIVGGIPDGLELDHLCRNRRCINPAHLEPVTHRQNIQRGKTATATHCVNGHAFTPENTHLRPRGARQCRACNRENQRRLKERRRAAA
jgi:hypothetical protein